MKGLMRWLLGILGLGLLAFGTNEVREATSGGGAVVLVVTGGVLAIIALLFDRLERLSVGSSGLELQFSREIAEQGAPSAAQILERSGVAGFAEAYGFIHAELADGKYRDAKVYLQDRLVERAAEVARQQKFEASEVRTLFRNGSPMVRVLTLGLMKGDPSLADGGTITSAIADSRSANEQYQGLLLAKLCWRQLSKSERQTILTSIDNDLHISEGADRQMLASELHSLPMS